MSNFDKLESAVASAPATPPHSSSNPALALEVTPPAMGLLTPPPSVLFNGKPKGRPRLILKVKARLSIKTASDGVDHTPPHQPSLSSSPATPDYMKDDVASPATPDYMKEDMSSPATPSYMKEVEASPIVAGDKMPSNPFDGTPLETIQQIASLLDSDQDLVHFRQSCRSVSDSLEGDGSSFWRRRFLSKYERPYNFEDKKKWNNVHYKEQYQQRRPSLKNGALFKFGRTAAEKKCAEVLRDLIKDSFSQKQEYETKCPGKIYEDKNLAAITRFCQSENILKSLFDGRNIPKFRSMRNPGTSTLLLQALQVILSPLIFTDLIERAMSFPPSQLVVYSPATKQKIFTEPGKVNMDWVLHQVNFWKHHFSGVESDLGTEVSKLDPAELPQMWNSQLSQYTNDDLPTVDRKWKGISAFLEPDDLQLLRRQKAHGNSEDHFSGTEGEGVIQDIALDMCDHEGTSSNMTKDFWNALNNHMPKQQRPRIRSDAQDDTPSTKPQTFRMSTLHGDTGKGVFYGDGWLEQLPPQGGDANTTGVPGWQRLSMMKYYKDIDNYVHTDTLWAYEGVMLPGSKVFLGRWWCPNDEANMDIQYSGPTILWSYQ